MFCQKCGKELRDDALFCDGCGTKIVREQPVNNNGPVKEGQVHKCPYCGEILGAYDIVCPTCGREIRDRGVTSSVQDFFNQISKIEDEEKKIELIKTFPIPNTKEDITEFMFLASSNYDAKYYATNKNKDSLASAWLSKIEQCYKKATVLFSNKADLAAIERIYNDVHSETQKITKTKLYLLIGGIALISISCILIYALQNAGTSLQTVFIFTLAAGIILTVFGAKKKKTNKEIELEKEEKQRKEEIKLRKKELENKR